MSDRSAAGVDPSTAIVPLGGASIVMDESIESSIDIKNNPCDSLIPDMPGGHYIITLIFNNGEPGQFKKDINTMYLKTLSIYLQLMDAAASGEKYTEIDINFIYTETIWNYIETFLVLFSDKNNYFGIQRPLINGELHLSGVPDCMVKFIESVAKPNDVCHLGFAAFRNGIQMLSELCSARIAHMIWRIRWNNLDQFFKIRWHFVGMKGWDIQVRNDVESRNQWVFMPNPEFKYDPMFPPKDLIYQQQNTTPLDPIDHIHIVKTKDEIDGTMRKLPPAEYERRKAEQEANPDRYMRYTPDPVVNVKSTLEWKYYEELTDIEKNPFFDPENNEAGETQNMFLRQILGFITCESQDDPDEYNDDSDEEIFDQHAPPHMNAKDLAEWAIAQVKAKTGSEIGSITIPDPTAEVGADGEEVPEPPKITTNTDSPAQAKAKTIAYEKENGITFVEPMPKARDYYHMQIIGSDGRMEKKPLHPSARDAMIKAIIRYNRSEPDVSRHISPNPLIRDALADGSIKSISDIVVPVIRSTLTYLHEDTSAPLSADCSSILAIMDSAPAGAGSAGSASAGASAGTSAGASAGSA